MTAKKKTLKSGEGGEKRGEGVGGEKRGEGEGGEGEGEGEMLDHLESFLREGDCKCKCEVEGEGDSKGSSSFRIYLSNLQSYFSFSTDLSICIEMEYAQKFCLAPLRS